MRLSHMPKSLFSLTNMDSMGNGKITNVVFNFRSQPISRGAKSATTSPPLPPLQVAHNDILMLQICQRIVFMSFRKGA